MIILIIIYNDCDNNYPHHCTIFLTLKIMNISIRQTIDGGKGGEMTCMYASKPID
jgi:hypothetical protein